MKNFTNKIFEKNMFLCWFCAYIYDFEGKFGGKNFSKKFFVNFFWSCGGVYREKFFFAVSKKNFFLQNSLRIINVGTKPLKKHIFFKNFISKIFHN